MRRWSLAVVALLATTVLAADKKAPALKLGKDDVGKVPAGWKADKTGKGEGSVWKVVVDDTAPSKSGYALAQMSESPGGLFNLCVANAASYKDVELSVTFKA